MLTSFSDFSVGFCINEEKGYLLPTLARKNNFADVSTECSSHHHPDDDWSIQSKRRQSFFSELELVTDNLFLC